MAVDLGINKPVQSAMAQWNFTVFNTAPRTFNSRKNPEEIEAIISLRRNSPSSPLLDLG